jgi:hypothetical protein
MYTKIGFEVVINSVKRLHSSVAYSEGHGSAMSEVELLSVLRNRFFNSKQRVGSPMYKKIQLPMYQLKKNEHVVGTWFRSSASNIQKCSVDFC